MAQEEQVATLTSLLSHYQAFITYQPLRTEVAVLDVATLPHEAVTFTIPSRASIDPALTAQKVAVFATNKDTAILLPGKRFDASGTRLGQGGGWYDRFLAGVPREWLRIGFCFDDQFSITPLKREPWDQAVDVVCVVGRENGSITLYSPEGEPS